MPKTKSVAMPKKPKSEYGYGNKSLSDFTKDELIALMIKLNKNRNLKLGKV